MTGPAPEPTPAPTLAHVTLTTGHVRESPRAEVGDDVIRLLRPLLARVWAGEVVPVPYVRGGYTLSGAEDHGCCALALAGPTGVVVATIGVAGDPAGARALWRQLHAYGPDGAPVVTDAERPPAVPWCAARLTLGAALVHRDALDWLGDLERCLAWTYLP